MQVKQVSSLLMLLVRIAIMNNTLLLKRVRAETWKALSAAQPTWLYATIVKGIGISGSYLLHT